MNALTQNPFALRGLIYKEDRMEGNNRPPYQRPCRITTADGGEYEAKLIHLNPRYHTHAMDPDLWRREGDIPRRDRYISPDKVTKWEEI